MVVEGITAIAKIPAMAKIPEGTVLVEQPIKEISQTSLIGEVENQEIIMNEEVELGDNLKDRTTSEGIQTTRENYENIDSILQNIEEKLEQANTDLELSAQEQRVEKYKGTVFEGMCKDELKEHFESVEDKQRIVSTEDGDTKPDIVLNHAKEDLQIGDVQVGKGEDLYCEVKCGRKEYLESEMSHIEKQVKGHEGGNSIVIVTKDYLDISTEKRVAFEQRLKENNSSIYVVDVYADQVEAAIYENILSA